MKKFTKQVTILQTAFEAEFINRNDLLYDFGSSLEKDISHLTTQEIIETYSEDLMLHYNLNWIQELCDVY